LIEEKFIGTVYIPGLIHYGRDRVTSLYIRRLYLNTLISFKERKKFPFEMEMMFYF